MMYWLFYGFNFNVVEEMTCKRKFIRSRRSLALAQMPGLMLVFALPSLEFVFKRIISLI